MIYSVGTRYPEFATGEDSIHAAVVDDGLEVVIRYNSPTLKEKENIGEGSPLVVRYTVIDGVMFFTFKFGELEWMDAPYSPAATSSVAIPKIGESEGLGMHLYFFNSADGELLSIRMVGLGHDFSIALASTIKDMPEISAKHYQNVVSYIQAMYSSMELASMSEDYYRLH